MDDARSRLVDGYWTFMRLASSPNRPDRVAADDWLWAFDEVGEATGRPDDSALDLLDDLLHSPDADPVAVGSGPLEDLLSEHGSMIAGRVADRARQDPLWRLAVGSCWLEASLAASLSRLEPFLPRRDAR